MLKPTFCQRLWDIVSYFRGNSNDSVYYSNINGSSKAFESGNLRPGIITYIVARLIWGGGLSERFFGFAAAMTPGWQLRMHGSASANSESFQGATQLVGKRGRSAPQAAYNSGINQILSSIFNKYPYKSTTFSS